MYYNIGISISIQILFCSLTRLLFRRWNKKWKMWKMYTNKFFNFLPLPLSFRNVKRVHIFIYLSLQHFSLAFFELSLLCLLAMKSKDFQLILPLLRYQKETRERANEFIHMKKNFMLLLSLKEALKIVLRGRESLYYCLKRGWRWRSRNYKIECFCGWKNHTLKVYPFFVFPFLTRLYSMHLLIFVAAIEFLVCILTIWYFTIVAVYS